MNLSPKAIRFILEALEYRIQAYQAQLETGLDEDEAADVTNDVMFLEALQQELEKAHESTVTSAS